MHHAQLSHGRTAAGQNSPQLAWMICKRNQNGSSGAQRSAPLVHVVIIPSADRSVLIEHKVLLNRSDLIIHLEALLLPMHDKEIEDKDSKCCGCKCNSPSIDRQVHACSVFAVRSQVGRLDYAYSMCVCGAAHDARTKSAWWDHWQCVVLSGRPAICFRFIL